LRNFRKAEVLMEEKKDKTFVVKDRRFFDETGETRPMDEPAKAQEPATPGNEEKAAEPPRAETEEFLSEVTFASFIISLSTTAIYHFGDLGDPETGKAERNLPAAKQTIDMLAMLKEKTSGNLDENEKNLLDGILYDLRMRYVREKTVR
jgi:hypothetical protein